MFIFLNELEFISLKSWYKTYNVQFKCLYANLVLLNCWLLNKCHLNNWLLKYIFGFSFSSVKLFWCITTFYHIAIAAVYHISVFLLRK